MSPKTDTEVLIGGKVFTLSGYESEDYMQKIASYINNKMTEYGKLDSFRRQSLDRLSVLLQLNIADDYFKAKNQADSMVTELISAQIKLENAEKQGKELQKQLNEDAKKIVRLETELKDK